MSVDMGRGVAFGNAQRWKDVDVSVGLWFLQSWLHARCVAHRAFVLAILIRIGALFSSMLLLAAESLAQLRRCEKL